MQSNRMARAISIGTDVTRLPNTRPRAKWAELICKAWQESIPSIFETGNLLEASKAELGHGAWLPMVREDLPFSKQTANKLMAIADNDSLRNDAHVRHLPVSWGTLYELTRLTPEQFDAGIKSGAINPKMERKDVAALRGIEPKPSKKKEKYPSKLIDWRDDMHDRLTYAAFKLKSDDRKDLFASIQHLVESLNRDFEQRERKETESAVRQS